MGYWIRSLYHAIAGSRSSRWSALIRPSHAISIGRLQPLEARIVPSATALPPSLVMLSAMTRDSQSVTVDYRIDALAQSPAPLQFNVYRSSNSRLDSGDSLVGSWSAQEGALSRDDNGQPLTAAGVHQLTIPLAAGLPPDPQKPFVVVVANPEFPLSATSPSSTASFRKYVIGIVTHGALINPSWKHGPPWELQTATLLRRQGYDAVIPFNWSSQSSNPGHAAAEGPRLAHQVLQTASHFPAGSPVDVQFISHSEGAVVNTQAIVSLERSITPELSAGYLVDTLLDPHAANNNVPGQANAAPGLLGAVAEMLVSSYQSRANDPAVFVPPGVNEAQVFYQHNPASRHHGIYNLWGQVPVPNFSDQPVAYYNLSATGAIHSGNFGVSLWYRNFVAPTLGDQTPLIARLRLEGTIENAINPRLAPEFPSALAQRRVQAWGPVRSLGSSSPKFTGTAAPGSRVRVYAGPADHLTVIKVIGQTTADSIGQWAVISRPLRDGCYRAVAMSYAPALTSRPGLAIVPMAPLGRFTIGAMASA
jgi:hypothetical protein